jgi:hypothetical protein
VGDGSQSRENLTAAGSATDGPEVDEEEAIVAEVELARGSPSPFTHAETGEPGVLVRTQEG